MKVLFLGGVFSKEMEKEILDRSKGVVHYAANKLQWNLIDGLLNVAGLDLNVLSAPFIGSYPRDYKTLFYRSYENIYNDFVQCKYVGFCNLWGLRNISRKQSLIKQIEKFVLDKSQNKTIIIYSPHTPFLEAAVYAKKVDPSIHICLVVPDLPQFMNLNEKKSFVYARAKEIDLKVFYKNAPLVDSFVLLTEHMKDMLHVDKRPYIIIEGVVNLKDIPKIDNVQNDRIKTIVYTGTLNKKFGVINLVKAFHALTRPDVNLMVCGRGDSEESIRGYSAKDKRIKFYGQISNEEAVKLQNNATILVNPRQNNEEYTRYSFPSKNMEYLLTGKPVIAYKLDGIPNDYDKHFYYVKDNSIEALTDKLAEVLDLSYNESFEFGKRAREFVIEHKNNKVAGSKIVTMINSNRKR